MNRSIRIEPGAHTRERSLRARSTSITCSARSLSDAISSASMASSSAASRPRGRVPAIGRSSHSPSAPSRTWVSGDEPISWNEPKSSRNMYGEGLTARSAR